MLLSHFSGPDAPRRTRRAGKDKFQPPGRGTINDGQRDVQQRGRKSAGRPGEREESDKRITLKGLIGGIEKAKNGDLDGAIADFDRAIELNPKDDAPYYNRAQAKRLKKDAAGAIADYTRAIEQALKTRPLTTTAATLERRITTGMAQLLIIRTQSNSNPMTRAPTTIALLLTGKGRCDRC